MVGMELEPVAEGTTPPGDGSKGAISGDSSSWKGDSSGGSDIETTGEAEAKDSKGEEAMKDSKRNQKDAIFLSNDKGINVTLIGEVYKMFIYKFIK